jgi:hypothetical protein
LLSQLVRETVHPESTAIIRAAAFVSIVRAGFLSGQICRRQGLITEDQEIEPD